jgi:site-specific DNA-cytosine methylase
MEYQSKVIHSHKSMVDSYNNNTTLTEADINLVKNIKEVDLLVGGPPCQGFSNVGRGKKKK